MNQPNIDAILSTNDAAAARVELAFWERERRAATRQSERRALHKQVLIWREYVRLCEQTREPRS